MDFDLCFDTSCTVCDRFSCPPASDDVLFLLQWMELHSHTYTPTHTHTDAQTTTTTFKFEYSFNYAGGKKRLKYQFTSLFFYPLFDREWKQTEARAHNNPFYWVKLTLEKFTLFDQYFCVY